MSHSPDFDAGKTVGYTLFVVKHNFDNREPIEKCLYIGDRAWLGIFRCSAKHPLFYKPAHFAGHNMITFPRTAVELHMLGQETVVASPNMVAFYNHGQEYHRKKLSETGDWCEWFKFSPRLLAEVIQRYDPQAGEMELRPFRHSHILISARTLLHQRRIVHHLLTAKQRDSLWLDEMLLHLLDGIIAESYQYRQEKTPKRKTTQRSHQDLVVETQKLLIKQLHTPVTLAQLAQQLHTSSFHLCRVFRQITGKTIHSYLEQLRLRTALEWLPEYQNNLSGLALAVGYKNHSHFTQAFRDAFGVPPSQIEF
ncbi:helix-turn-helix transcriptional regulator [Candidatus Leptofilum sp.]|uniref:helix-turn-helix transcriptional regulator n=1 Tax=Candidatus Leptofilum sp. TaxID=3241576 RepID=UPI003B5BB2D5